MSWLRRNWKWLVPVILLFVVGLIFSVMAILKSSEPYQLAVEALRQDARAIEVLGTPIDEGFMPQGSVQTSSAGGSAELRIQVSGPRAEGVLYVRASKSAGQWTMELLVLQVDNQRISLLEVEGSP